MYLFLYVSRSKWSVYSHEGHGNIIGLFEILYEFVCSEPPHKQIRIISFSIDAVF